LLSPASLGLFFRILKAFLVFVMGNAIYSIQAFLSFIPATILVAFLALSLLKSLIPRLVCAALAQQQAKVRSQQSRSANHYCPFSFLVMDK
jgi:hypothetical protein